ncbi:MAG: GTPase ObgE [Candidatus Latescibacteria bacterium]|nr:GTPase ObgE [bacterium]MBD3425469.1 GTPase ObgE [Candidatus Latescibacterota bacterium]
MKGHFIDRVEIEASAGRGGDGCVSFRREKHVPRGGPDGGRGGKGGDIIIRVNPGLRTLIDLRYQKTYSAENGRAGSGSNRTGRSGKDQVIEVPPGTVIEDLDSGEVLADLKEEGDQLIACRGGDGGKGNYSFKTSTDKAPRRATPGEEGEERKLRLIMKLIADAGTVGFPNAGKSTLLSAVSGAHPKIASYPFTTITPTLGIVRVGEYASFCMVDIPGLISGAHQGKGLGIQFLQHIERCRVLLFVIDASRPEEPDEIFSSLLRELSLYSEKLIERDIVIALNKTDLLEEEPDTDSLSAKTGREVFPISAATGRGVPELIGRLYSVIQQSRLREEE